MKSEAYFVRSMMKILSFHCVLLSTALEQLLALKKGVSTFIHTIRTFGSRIKFPLHRLVLLADARCMQIIVLTLKLNVSPFYLVF